MKKEKCRNKNITLLLKKSRELKKPIPDELLVAVCSDMPQGAWFFEKYKEWFQPVNEQ